MKLGIISCSSLKTTSGGGVTYTIEAKRALEGQGISVETEDGWRKVLQDGAKGLYDAIWMTSIGLNGENGKSAGGDNAERFAMIDKVLDKGTPIIATLHCYTEHSVFRQSYGFWEARGFPFALLLVTCPSMKRYAASRFKTPEPGVLRIPFDVKGLGKKPPEKDSRLIVSASRLTSAKRTNYILDLARALQGTHSFDVYGDEKGFYWYHNLRENPQTDYVNMRGGYRNPEDLPRIYRRAAWNIDLAVYKDRGMFDGGRIQYVVIEGICFGALPVLWDFWTEDWGDGPFPFHGVRIPNPLKEGRKEGFDLAGACEAIRSASYRWRMAKENFEALIDHHDTDILAPKYAELIGSL